MALKISINRRSGGIWRRAFSGTYWRPKSSAHEHRLKDAWFIGGSCSSEAEESLRAILAILEKPAEKNFEEIVFLKIRLSQSLAEQARYRAAAELALFAENEAKEYLPDESSPA